MGRFAKIFEKIPLSGFLVDKFMENYAIIAVAERNRLQEQKLLGIFPGPRGPKNHF
jgi:hypothetical protein